MRVRIMNWAHESKVTETLEELKIHVGEIDMTTEEVYAHARKIFEAGLNVAPYHGNDTLVLGVDTRCFQQR